MLGEMKITNQHVEKIDFTTNYKIEIKTTTQHYIIPMC